MNPMATLEWLNTPIAAINTQTQQFAQARQAQLTKPPGSLGRLETIAIQLAGLQSTTQPSVERTQITIFAGDHGVTAEGVSAFPQSVTGQMIRNFSLGGGAINVLARSLGATLEIINLGTVDESQSEAKAETPADVKQHHLGQGTANFLHEPAMSRQQVAQALNIGREVINQAKQKATQLFIGGEMGIGNTTSATALACALLNTHPADLTGPGTGLDHTGVTRKINVIERALALHKPDIHTPLDALCRVGGFEIAALTGAYIHGAQLGLPMLIDGFISSAAALTAEQMAPGCKQWFIFSHQSAEPGHRLILQALEADPLVNLAMRLGEGSGAAVTVSLLRMACRLHNEMATFSEAQVSGKND